MREMRFLLARIFECGAVIGWMDCGRYAREANAPWSLTVWDLCWVGAVLTLAKVLSGKWWEKLE